MDRKLALAVALLTLPLAGCLGVGEDAGVDKASVAAAEDARVDGNATVEAGTNATAPTDMTGGHAPHIHNYWGENDRITLYDDAVDVQVLSPVTFLSLFVEKRPELGGAFFEFPDGATVYEGTGLMDVTARWTDATITGLALRYKSPDMKSGFEYWSDWLPLSQGAPTTITITPAMTDMPHDAKSRWLLEIAAAGTPGIAQGAVDLKVDIVRMRDVMTFPGHPDTYEDAAFYVLADEEFDAKGQNRLNEFAGFVTGTGPDTAWYPPNIVPMETRALLLEVTILQAGQTAPLAEQAGIQVEYTTADSRRDVRAQLLNQTGDTFVYGIPVADANVDSPYKDESSWHFHIRPQQKLDAPAECRGCLDYEMKVHLRLTAYAEDPTGGQIEAAEEDEEEDEG